MKNDGRRWGWRREETSVPTDDRDRLTRRGGGERTGSLERRESQDLSSLPKRNRIPTRRYARPSLRPPLPGVSPALRAPLLSRRQRGTPCFFPRRRQLFISCERLTYFLSDVGLKFHAIVVTICSKKLIEPGRTVSGRVSRGSETTLHGVPCETCVSSLSRLFPR